MPEIKIKRFRLAFTGIGGGGPGEWDVSGAVYVTVKEATQAKTTGCRTADVEMGGGGLGVRECCTCGAWKGNGTQRNLGLKDSGLLTLLYGGLDPGARFGSLLGLSDGGVCVLLQDLALDDRDRGAGFVVSCIQTDQ